MSAATPTTPSIATNGPGIPFTRLVAVEWRKMVDTVAGRWLMIVTALIMVLAIVGMLLAVALDDDFAPTANAFSSVLQLLVLLLAPVLAIMVITSEWGQRTHLTAFTLEPRRTRVLGAKLGAVILFALATLALALVLGAAGNAATSLFDRDVVWDLSVSDLAWAVFLQFALILSAFALGLLVLNTAAAVAIFYVAAIVLRFIVYPILMGFFGWFVDLAPFLDVFFGFAVAADGMDLDGDAIDGIARFAPLVSSLTLWLVIPGVIGTWRATRAEVK